jgi:hypothetical protein
MPTNGKSTVFQVIFVCGSSILLYAPIYGERDGMAMRLYILPHSKQKKVNA